MCEIRGNKSIIDIFYVIFIIGTYPNINYFIYKNNKATYINLEVQVQLKPNRNLHVNLIYSF